MFPASLKKDWICAAQNVITSVQVSFPEKDFLTPALLRDAGEYLNPIMAFK
jgi:hypothetical protein